MLEILATVESKRRTLLVSTNHSNQRQTTPKQFFHWTRFAQSRRCRDEKRVLRVHWLRPARRQNKDFQDSRFTPVRYAATFVTFTNALGVAASDEQDAEQLGLENLRTHGKEVGEVEDLSTKSGRLTARFSVVHALGTRGSGPWIAA